jgi:hypothetical protein
MVIKEKMPITNSSINTLDMESEGASAVIEKIIEALFIIGFQSN